MSKLSEWMDPLRPGDVVIAAIAGKTIARVRYCPKDPQGERSFGEGHFFEFQFADGSIFRIDSCAGFKAQYMRRDSDGDLAGDITDYGTLGAY